MPTPAAGTRNASEDDWTMPLLVRQAKGLPVERLPVWLMRQAGRYLPEYHERRKRPDGSTVDFFDAIRDAEMAADLTLQPVRRFGVDAAIVYSDILIIPSALGMTVEMVPTGKKSAEKQAGSTEVAKRVESSGPMRPNFPQPLVDPSDLDRLNFEPDIEQELGFVCNTIRRTRELLSIEGKVDVAVIGFTGGPWTLMTYMLGEMGGGGGGAFAKAKKWLYCYPKAARKLLDGISKAVADFLIAQANAGAHMVQVFDSWAGALSPRDFEIWELPSLRQVAERFKATCPSTPIVVMAKGAHYAMSALAAIPAIDVLGLDWMTPAEQIRGAGAAEELKSKVVQGNIDPAALMADPCQIADDVCRIIESFTADGSGYIGNVGNGLLTTTPVEGVAAMVKAVQGWRPNNMDGTLRIGTRASALALVQARWAARQIKRMHPKINVEIVEIKALGDKVQDCPLHEIKTNDNHGNAMSTPASASSGTVGAVFTKELEEALLEGSVDVLVRLNRTFTSSLVNCIKDMETKQPDGLTLVAVCERGDPRDVLVMSKTSLTKGWKTLDDLPAGATIGTSSLRRTALLSRLRPDIVVQSVRGNVQTRLAKLDGEHPHPVKYDAIILAAVGLQRMGYCNRISAFLSPDTFPYAVGQGSLGIECRDDDAATIGLVKFLDEPKAAMECKAERAFLRALAGGCRVPVGVASHARSTGSNSFDFEIAGRIWSTDGSIEFASQTKEQVSSELCAEACGRACAEKISAAAAAAGHMDVVSAIADIANK